jgi:hypothetical protein
MKNFLLQKIKNVLILCLRRVNEAHDEAYRHCFQLFITVRTNGITTHLFAIMQNLIENH